MRAARPRLPRQGELEDDEEEDEEDGTQLPADLTGLRSAHGLRVTALPAGVGGSAFERAKVRSVNTEDLYDVQQQADFFLSLGQHEQALGRAARAHRRQPRHQRAGLPGPPGHPAFARSARGLCQRGTRVRAPSSTRRCRPSTTSARKGAAWSTTRRSSRASCGVAVRGRAGVASRNWCFASPVYARKPSTCAAYQELPAALRGGARRERVTRGRLGGPVPAPCRRCRTPAWHVGRAPRRRRADALSAVDGGPRRPPPVRAARDMPPPRNWIWPTWTERPSRPCARRSSRPRPSRRRRRSSRT